MFKLTAQRAKIGCLLLTPLLSTLLHAAPFVSYPTMPEFISRMENEGLTFLCNCEFSEPYGKLDNEGCATPAKKAVMGNIVTAKMLKEWIYSDKPENLSGINEIMLNETLKIIVLDPLNMTLFEDNTYPHYSRAKTITGTMLPSGKFGACRFSAEGDTARIADGRLGEYARTALYLKDQYSIQLPQKVVTHLLDINRMLPPNEREITRNIRAYKWNGSWNNYVMEKPNKSEIDHSVRKGLLEYIYRHTILGD